MKKIILLSLICIVLVSGCTSAVVEPTYVTIEKDDFTGNLYTHLEIRESVNKQEDWYSGAEIIGLQNKSVNSIWNNNEKMTLSYIRIYNFTTEENANVFYNSIKDMWSLGGTKSHYRTDSATCSGWSKKMVTETYITRIICIKEDFVFLSSGDSKISYELSESYAQELIGIIINNFKYRE